MIRFCDKVVYNVIKGQVTRTQLLNFFLCEEERIFDVVAVYSIVGELCGIITYEKILGGGYVEDCINKTMLQVSEQFWEEAHEYFKQNPKELLTIVDGKRAILGFAYDEDDDYYYDIFSAIKSMEKEGIPALKAARYRHVKMFVITDLNELAWLCCQVFRKEGYQVCVVGEKWGWFGEKSGEGYLDYAEFEKLYIYAEGTAFLRKERKFVEHRFGNIKENFGEILGWAWERMQIGYSQMISDFIKKGVSVCECRMPSSEDIDFKTELEWISIEQNIFLNSYIRNKSSFSDKRKSYLEAIYGKKTIKILEQHKSSFSLKDNDGICLGNFMGKVLSNDNIVLKRKIYLIGPCIVEGYGCILENTLLAELQELVKIEDYQVVGVPIIRDDYEEWKRLADDIPICKGDILIFINTESVFEKSKHECHQIDVLRIYNNRNRNTIFSEIPIHTNAEGNRILAKVIYQDYLKKEMNRWKNCDREFLQKGQILPEVTIQRINNYIENVRIEGEGTVGAIVMNCNPFTYGQRYLIEYAANQVDVLYVFVVEEDRSFFKFEDRLHMVREGTKDITNIKVIPSGRWVLSYETFPSYFEKSSKQEMRIDASNDLEIFARYIAPPLKIGKRFVGDEPLDKVTRQYNYQMQEILTWYNIKVDIIPRRQLDGEVISASRVRYHMKEQNWEQVRRLVPETTYQRLKQL